MRFDSYLRRAEENGKVIFAKEYCLTDKEQAVLASLGYNKKSLETLKRNPAQYACQMNNDPLDDDLIEFRRDWFLRSERTPELMQQLMGIKALISIDPAFRLKQTNDFSGLVVTKALDDGRVFILEAKQMKINAAQLIEEIFKLVSIYKPYKVCIETVSAQILLVDLLKNEMKKRNVWFTIEEVKTSTTETKAMKIRGLVEYYSNGRIVHLGQLVDLEGQLLEFPRGTHDDIIDALSQQIPFWKFKNPQKISPTQKEYTWEWWSKKTNKPKTGISKLFQDLKGM
jgi:predicted phage terminase large subunit-like protein